MKFVMNLLAVVLALNTCICQTRADINISLSYLDGASAYQSDFDAAAATWSKLLLGYQNGIVAPGGGNAFYNVGQKLPGVMIRASLIDTNAFYGLGTVTGAILDHQNHILPTDGTIQISSSIFQLLDQNQRQTVLLHEMAHVLGFGGDVWRVNGLFNIIGNPTYLGAHATAAWQAEFSRTDSPLLESLGGDGTSFGHWAENLVTSTINGNVVVTDSADTGIVDALGRDFRYELMTGWIDTPTFISNTTIQSFADVGYITAVPEPTSVLLLSVGGACAFIYRRKNAGNGRGTLYG
jgi:hypothetical protein